MQTLAPADTRSSDLTRALRAITRRVAPTWPLDRFVAVNPYLGLLERPFEDAAALLERVAAARSTLRGEDYRARLSSGELRREELEEVIAERSSHVSAERALALLEQGDLDAPPRPVRCVADVLDEVTGGSWSRFTRDHLGAWCAAYFDEL